MFINRPSLFAGIVLALLAAHLPATEPDDIAYLRLTDGYWQIWLTDRNGDQHQQLTDGQYDFSRVHWLHDHQFLIASRGDGVVFKIDPESGKQQRLPLPFDEILDASVSPDGEWLAFSYAAKQGTQSTMDIWRARLDGSDAQQLTDLGQAMVVPMWSPTGDKLAFTYLSLDEGKHYEIWEIDLDSKARKQHTAGEAFNFDPAYGPNGELAYTSNYSGQYDIWVQMPDGTRTRLTEDKATEEQASWSPDGQHIVYVSFAGGQQRIWVSDKHGKNARPISPENTPSRAPAWFN